jgi:hypothetical protein
MEFFDGFQALINREGNVIPTLNECGKILHVFSLLIHLSMSQRDS